MNLFADGSGWLGGWLGGWLQKSGMPAEVSAELVQAGVCVLGLALAVAAYKGVLLVIARAAVRMAARTKTKWDDAVIETQLLHRLAHFAPLIVINAFGGMFFVPGSEGFAVVKGFAHLYLIVVSVGVAISVLDFLCHGVLQTRWGAEFPVKGLAQAFKLAALLVAAIQALSVLLGKSPAYLLSGIGALTAILMLVFKDAILGLTAGIMLSANRMVCIGDWIEMPSAGADGSVVDVSLTTVKVQNWDLTITSIPAYSLVSSSFKNWRGMSEAGGRRIKRAVFIDMQTVRFADEGMLARWRKIGLLRPYLTDKLAEIERSNKTGGLDPAVLGNGRRLTNLGTFRAYCVAYLRRHAQIHQGMTLIVRQLAPTEHGMPLEIYAFTNDTDWVRYEGIQSDIFDHLLSVIGEFGLAVYQRSSDAETRPARF
jgi:miniconductance mechanosensitive channel